ncbi:uncharacterized protein LOC121637044 isoform X1 [Melanotaenia boesemani]|uniref:uncharacterized protein LOC121636906 isoform X1 n=2 Tax=Melanotaenia boesemani TaxID=1250792 RepID=UPI001C03FCF6|nr:uncharacterized protein LOC121636906 isoform X1 [Melanotaenia boesemani]XP_041836873.1 uncharacterized protein LOC121637044 isoform X1 [Melanotaenia boesemani]
MQQCAGAQTVTMFRWTMDKSGFGKTSINSGMMSFKLKWLIVIQLLLNEQALCRVPPPLVRRSSLFQETHTPKETEETIKQDHHPLLETQSLPTPSSTYKSVPDSPVPQKEERVHSAQRMTSILRAKLQGKIKNNLLTQGNVSCEEVLSASTLDDPLSSMFPQELLGLSLVPVLVVGGCPKEAQTLVLKLYDLLGEADTEELLMEVEALIEHRMSKFASTPAPASAAERDEMRHHMDAVMFNIEQLGLVGEGISMQDAHCEGWIRVNGTMLVGSVVEGTTGGLDDAVSSCERLGILCAGVTSGGHLTPGMYQAVLKKGSRIFPSSSPQTESWIRQCSAKDDVLIPTALGQRMKRSSQRNCVDENEEQVYSVVEWIPIVSTLYSLGTAVYYASINCKETAKERAILGAVDLGMDALNAVTGGAAGVAGYALGAGVKTGVKNLLNSMKDEDLLLNQISRDDVVITIRI